MNENIINRPKYQFETAKDWMGCTTIKGTNRVVFGDDCMHIDHIITARGRCIMGSEINSWLTNHPEVAKQAANWAVARDEAMNAWKHKTPHARYDADAGSLAILANGVKVMVGNGEGDGNFPVYILKHDGLVDWTAAHTWTMPHTFKPTGTTVCDCTIQVLDYDCEGGKPMSVPVFDGDENPIMTEIMVKNATFYRDGRGAVAIVCHMA